MSAPPRSASWRGSPAAAGVALLTLLAAGCTGTSRDLTPSFVEAWGCDYERVQRKYNKVSVQRMSRAVRYGSRALEAKARRDSTGGLNEPEPGWSACRLMERNGRSNESGIEETAAGRRATWKYVVRDLYDRVQAVHVVRLSPGEANEEADWVVREVEW